jgi:imidazolonepropionase-like amidohydrolase
VATVADGVDQLLAFDPLNVTQYAPEELKAAVDAAADWGSYVTVHVYGDKGIRRVLDPGVKVIDHGLLMTEETKKKKAQVSEGADNACKPAKNTDQSAFVVKMTDGFTPYHL